MFWKICIAALVLSAATFGQSAITEPKLIAYAKGLDVSRLDPTLPKQSLEKWFSAQGIAEDELVWRRSDCDLMPDFAKPEEPRPLCVDFVNTVASKAGIFGKIFVGTDQKGIDGPPRFGEGAAGDGYVYTANGKVLDPKRVVTGLQTMLRVTEPGKTRMFVLFDQGVSLGKTFELASLIETVIGLDDVRYFAFSRKTGVMQEIKPSWDRWKLSFDGKLERKPF